MSEAPQTPAELLELLRCPVGLKMAGENAGALTVAADGWWLVCEQSGYKYPVSKDSGPDMRPSVGKQWAETAVVDLPVPPPTDTESDED